VAGTEVEVETAAVAGIAVEVVGIAAVAVG